jgi:hypothetical protein
MSQEAYKENEQRERILEARHEKFMQCLIHNKICSMCDGFDIANEKCKYKKHNVIGEKQ